MGMSSVNLSVFIILVSLLSGVSLILYFNKNRITAENYLELNQRMQSWWVMVILLIIALSINVASMILFLMFISYLALKEYFTIIPTRRADRRIIFIAYLSIPLQYLWVSLHWYGMFVIFIPIYMFLFIPIRMVMLNLNSAVESSRDDSTAEFRLKKTEGFLRAIGTIQWGIMLTVYCLSHIAYLGVLPSGLDWHNTGISMMIYLIALTQMNDVSQYVFGKWLGHKKVIPIISPNKTVAGFLGGFLSTLVLAILLAPILTPMNFLFASGAGCLIALMGFAGDLTMSAVKRDLGIKDTGCLLPGHGGILDRLDSLIFTAPLFFHYVRYFYF